MISKQLKFVHFGYDLDTKTLNIATVDPASREVTGQVTLPRHYMFSLARFIIRIAQKGRKRK
jgi:hypothetical protein